jgi:hypothetical protein
MQTNEERSAPTRADNMGVINEAVSNTKQYIAPVHNKGYDDVCKWVDENCKMRQTINHQKTARCISKIIPCYTEMLIPIMVKKGYDVFHLNDETFFNVRVKTWYKYGNHNVKSCTFNSGHNPRPFVVNGSTIKRRGWL